MYGLLFHLLQRAFEGECVVLGPSLVVAVLGYVYTTRIVFRLYSNATGVVFIRRGIYIPNDAQHTTNTTSAELRGSTDSSAGKYRHSAKCDGCYKRPTRPIIIREYIDRWKSSTAATETTQVREEGVICANL